MNMVNNWREKYADWSEDSISESIDSFIAFIKTRYNDNTWPPYCDINLIKYDIGYRLPHPKFLDFLAKNPQIRINYICLYKEPKDIYVGYIQFAFYVSTIVEIRRDDFFNAKCYMKLEDLPEITELL